MDDLITIINKERTLQASINPMNGQLCSLQRDGQEFMWGGGKPEHLKRPEERAEAKGWQNSEIIMFPIVGPAKDNQLVIDGKRYFMPQHGIVRCLPAADITVGKRSIGVKREYQGGTPVETPKGIARFPTSFSVYALYDLVGDSLEATFNISNRSDESMSYAFGWHPAFKLPEKPQGFVYAEHGPNVIAQHTLAQIRECSKTSAFLLENTPSVMSSITESKQRRTIKVAHDLGQTMVWSPPGQHLICIEPVTASPQSDYVKEFAGKPGNREIPHGSIAVYQVKITPTVVA